VSEGLTGRIALVTGASRGIGRAVSDELRAAGAHVVRLARSLSDGSSERQTDFRCDVSDAGQVDRVVAKVLKELRAPDIVVNNAGIFFIKSLEETTVQDFAQAIAVNLMGPFLVARALLPHLVKRGSGHLVTIGSIADHVGFTGSTAYGATKFGVRGMHESIVAELAKTGVRTTLISPGPVRAVTVMSDVMGVPEFVMNAFSPSMTHSPADSSSVAFVRVPPASLPASGSVSPNAPSARPAHRSGNQRCFCSSLPNE